MTVHTDPPSGPSPLSRPCPHCNGTGVIRELDVAALVLAIAEGFGDHAFNARELVAHARTEGGPLAVALDGRSPRRVGKALRQLTGHNIHGFCIQRIGSDREGAILQLVRVD